MRFQVKYLRILFDKRLSRDLHLKREELNNRTYFIILRPVLKLNLSIHTNINIILICTNLS